MHDATMIVPGSEPAVDAGDVRSLRLLEELCEGELGPRDLAAALGLTLADLARWVMLPDNAVLLDGLLRLADARTAMVIARYRANAAAVLINIATQHERDDRPDDLARKACVDLLNVETRRASGRETPAARGNVNATATQSSSPPTAASEEAILRALETLAEQEQAAFALERSGSREQGRPLDCGASQEHACERTVPVS
jgi:hypothetical protein